MKNNDSKSALRKYLPFVIAGSTIMLLFQIQCSIDWQHYLFSVPGYPEAFSKGQPPGSFWGGSPLSRHVGIMILFMGTIAVGLGRSLQPFKIGLSVLSGALVVQIASWIVIYGFVVGNLWPVDVAMVLWYNLLPIVTGVIVLMLLRILFGSRKDVLPIKF